MAMSKFEKYQRRKSGNRKSSLEGLRIRRAELRDVPALARINWLRENGVLETHIEKFEQEMKIARPDKHLLIVAEQNKNILGYARAVYFVPKKDAPANICPEGWHLTGLIVDPRYRKLGIASELTAKRLSHIASIAVEAYYFANAKNPVSIELHKPFGFEEISRDFTYPGVEFEGGEGILFRADLSDFKSA